MERFKRTEKECKDCLYFGTCTKNRIVPCDDFLDCNDEDSWFDEYAEEERDLYREQWYQYTSEYCD